LTIVTKKSEDKRMVLFIAPAILGEISIITTVYLLRIDTSSIYLCSAEVMRNHLWLVAVPISE
jgi:hypothetical protein